MKHKINHTKSFYIYHHKIPKKSISVLRLHQLQEWVWTVELPQSIASIWSWTDLIVRDQISSVRKKQMHGGRRALSRLSSTYRVSAIKSVPSPSPRGCNRATLLDLDAAMRTARPWRDACATQSRSSGASNDVRASTWFGRVPRHIAWWKCLRHHVVVGVGHGPSLSLSLFSSLSLLRERPLSPDPSSLAARSLTFSPPTPSRRTHAAATRAAPMTLSRLPLLLLARTYSGVRDTKGNSNGRSSISMTSGIPTARVNRLHVGCFSQPIHHQWDPFFSYFLFFLFQSRGEFNPQDRRNVKWD